MTEYLYCIRSIGAGPGIAKIGVTRNVRSRFQTITTCAPFRCTLHRAIAFDTRQAADAWEDHILRQATRYRADGEWIVADVALDRLLSDVRGGRDVTADHFRCYRGRPVKPPKDLPARAAGLTGKRAANLVRARLADGYGVEDMAAMDGLDLTFARQEVARLRSIGRLIATVQMKGIAA